LSFLKKARKNPIGLAKIQKKLAKANSNTTK
jgi:hypothetical protein